MIQLTPVGHGNEVVPPGDNPPLRNQSIFWWGFWLAILLIANKALLLHTVGSDSRLHILLHPASLLVPTYQDIPFVFCLAAIGQAALSGAARFPRFQRLARRVFLGMCILCVVFTVLSYQLFVFLQYPLTFGLLRSAGSARMITSSVWNLATRGAVMGFIMIPVLYFIACVASDRYLPIRSTRRGWMLILGMGLLAAVQWGYGYSQLKEEQWSVQGNQLLATNPHWALIASGFTDLSGGARSVAMPHQFPADYLADFAPPSRVAHPAGFPGAGPRIQNVIIVVLESVPARHLSLYGSPHASTPILAAEAAHSLILDQFYAHVGQSTQSLIALTLSRYPPFRTLRPAAASNAPTPGAEQSTTHLLHEKGYRTSFMTATNFDTQDRFLHEQGFDSIDDSRNLGCPLLFSWGVRDSCLFDRLISWIRQDRERPFYSVVWTTQTHHPYALDPGRQPIRFLTGPPSEERDTMNRYLSAINEADAQIGKLFAALRKDGLAENTVVFITGDHGESFNDLHHSRFHGFDLFEEDVHVPLIIWSPTLFDKPARSASIGGHIDIGPTILDILGIDPPRTFQGRSLLDPDRSGRAYFFADKSYLLFGLRSTHWKYIFNSVTAKEQLFDLTDDPEEKRNVAAQHEPECNEFRERLGAWTHSQAMK